MQCGVRAGDIWNVACVAFPSSTYLGSPHQVFDLITGGDYLSNPEVPPLPELLFTNALGLKRSHAKSPPSRYHPALSTN